MKKVYFIYVIIPENIYNKTIKYIISNSHDYRWKHGKMFGLYAWTTKKKVVKEFFEIRDKRIYTLVEKEITGEYYDELKSTHSSLELKLRSYDHFNDKQELEKIDVVSTKNEWVCATIDNMEYIDDFGPAVYGDLPVDLFNDKLINALDVIGYVSKYYIEYGTESEADMSSYNLSFGISERGNVFRPKCEDTLNVLLYLFGYLFYASDKGRGFSE